MHRAWNNWFHCTGSTKGTWLRGDPRGWRARHHREHCEGDYKNPPPPGAYRELYELSKRLTKRKIVLTPGQREFLCRAMAESLLYREVELIDLCIGAKHWHVLARFKSLDWRARPKEKNRDPRHLMGLAKKRSARALSKAGLIDEGGVWAVRCRPLPIRDRSHQLNVAKYIPDHKKKGAAVWSLLKWKWPEFNGATPQAQG